MKKNQIVFVVILAAIVFVLTFIIAIFSIFRLDSFQIESHFYEKELIDSKIIEKVEREIEGKFKGRSSIFFGVKEVERTLNTMSDNNKNYLIVQKVEKLSPKAVRITIGQRQIDNYCYKVGNQYHHFNAQGELLQMTDSPKNLLLSKENAIVNNLMIPDTVVKFATRVQVGQAVTGENATENEKLNSLKVILQTLDVYFAKDRQYRTCQYVKVVENNSTEDNFNKILTNFSFTIQEDWHYVEKSEDGNYKIFFSDVTVQTVEKAEAMYKKLMKLEKTKEHVQLFVVAGVENTVWTKTTMRSIAID